MELLLQAIEKKLSHVDNERNRWMQYKDEHEQASNNLREFQKSFHKEILVPIGSKALMPGHLYHTNEIFVGMYGGLFVKCSADKALSVCEHRMGEANKRIDALNVEHKMYKDRLELPVNESVFGNAGGTQEIIEEYDEDEEKKWREQHKIRVREQKQAEAEERKRNVADDDIDINAILEQAELMEELENELEMLNVNDEEQMQQHLQSSSDLVNSDESAEHEEMSQLDAIDAQPDKDANDQEDECDERGSKEFLSLSAATTGLTIEDKIKFYEIHLQKTRDYFAKTLCTIHNFDEFTDKRVTEECLQTAIEELQETLNNYTTEAEVKPIKHQENKNNCNPNEPRKFHCRKDFDEIEREYALQNKSKSELLIFYKSQLRNVMKSIAGCTIDLHSREEKRHLYEFLSDRISSLRDEIQKEKQIKLEEDFVDDDDIDKEMKQLSRNFEPNSTDLDDYKEEEVTGKRKISFASAPVTVTFFEDDEPCVVSQENINSLMDSTFQFFNSPSSSSASSVCGDDEENTNPGDEHHPMNSTNDCDMNFPMNQCNDHVSNQNKPSTLILQFEHSSNVCTATASNDDETINSPLDIYKQFGANIEPSSPSIESNALQVQNRINGNHDTKCETANNSLSFMEKAMDVPNINAKPAKSILKNRSLVQNEARSADGWGNNDGPLDSNEPQDEFPGFTQVLGEIVERSDANETDASSQANDIQSAYLQTYNASTNNEPKKRVSLFKKSRMS